MDENKAGGGQGTKRERSTIAFPYGNLDDAVAIAEAMQARLGSSCEPDQLAAVLGTDANNGTFRMRIATARTFGIIDVARRRIMLSDLGARIADEQQAQDARVEAFLNVPLYHAVYERYHGRRLPGDKGLESEMVQLGVSTKQADKARQAFQRSAEQAGFFAHGRDRLVLPVGSNLHTVQASVATPPEDQPTTQTIHPASIGGPDLEGLHPLLVGLIKMIPREGEGFSPKRQRQWLEAAKVNFALIFGSEEEGPERANDGSDA